LPSSFFIMKLISTVMFLLFLAILFNEMWQFWHQIHTRLIVDCRCTRESVVNNQTACERLHIHKCCHCQSQCIVLHGIKRNACGWLAPIVGGLREGISCLVRWLLFSGLVCTNNQTFECLWIWGGRLNYGWLFSWSFQLVHGIFGMQTSTCYPLYNVFSGSELHWIGVSERYSFKTKLVPLIFCTM
jgi:hypothetical protein